MKIDTTSIVNAFGFAMESDALRKLLVEYGFDPEYSAATLRKQGSVNIVDEKRGIELMFSEREKFERLCGQAKSEGSAILSAVAVYPNGSKYFKKFSGTIGRSLDGALNRNAVLAVLGEGTALDEEDGKVVKETWTRDGVVHLIQYLPDGTTKSIQFGMPRNYG
jgi:hypothetical protein